MIEQTEENMEKLAIEIVDGWDIQALIDTSVEYMIEYYRDHPVQFQETWQDTFEWSENGEEKTNGQS